MKTYLAKMFGWVRLHTMALAVLLWLAAILPPVQVQGQISPCCAILSAGLGTINTTLGSVIGRGLSSINGVLTTIQQFEQQVVWPVQAIALAYRDERGRRSSSAAFIDGVSLCRSIVTVCSAGRISATAGAMRSSISASRSGVRSMPREVRVHSGTPT